MPFVTGVYNTPYGNACLIFIPEGNLKNICTKSDTILISVYLFIFLFQVKLTIISLLVIVMTVSQAQEEITSTTKIYSDGVEIIVPKFTANDKRLLLPCRKKPHLMDMCALCAYVATNDETKWVTIRCCANIDNMREYCASYVQKVPW